MKSQNKPKAEKTNTTPNTNQQKNQPFPQSTNNQKGTPNSNAPRKPGRA
ncbi:MAG: hypothetical protein H6617_07355 [Bdellovibrionaceae bacterium]|nr:hypothetical protein [Pseudobdellovibrionaceae bacterium]